MILAEQPVSGLPRLQAAPDVADDLGRAGLGPPPAAEEAQAAVVPAAAAVFLVERLNRRSCRSRR
jgi:hypothetical protein